MTIFQRIYTTMLMLQDRAEHRERGAAMVEYALLVAGIAVVVGAVVVTLGTAIATKFTGITTSLG